MPLLAFLGPLKCFYRTAFFMAFLIFPAAAESSAYIRFQRANGTVGRKQLGPPDRLKWNADQRFKRATARHWSWHSNRLIKRRFRGCRA